jgi:hypothetical protein
MKKTAICLALVGLLALGGQAIAEIGTIDDVPAATLLLPYFAVDLNDPQALTTLFSINNASAAPAIAHVTLWTDLSVPTLDFNVYLTGYDVVTFNLRDLFTTGTTPQTEHVNDADAISPVGEFSLVTNPISGVGPGSTSCNGQLPLPPLPAVLLDHIRAAHTGQGSPVVFGGLCSGVDYGDNIARGYITIDSVNFCTLDFPGDTGYFIGGGVGAANNLNQLWGDYFYVNAAQNFAQGETLAHLEASNALGAGNYTFYRRYSGGADQREGMASTFAVRYADGGAFDGGTHLAVWRDAKRTIFPFSCALVAPTPYPLSQNQIVIFDEDENPDVPESSPFSPAIPGTSLIPFPWETQNTEVNGPDFPVPFSFGWLYLNLNNAVAGSQVPFEPIMQNWVTATMDANGRFSVGFDAIQLDNVTDPAAASDVSLPICDGAPDPAACN